MRIFHITSGAEAAAATRAGTYVPEPYARDGFIHCSYREQVLAVAAGTLVRNVAWKLVQNFVGTGVTALTMQAGYDLAAGTDDPDGFIADKSVLNGVAPIAFATGDGAALVTSGGFVTLVAADIEVLATAVGANLNLLTAGKIQILLDLVDLNEIARPYEAE